MAADSWPPTFRMPGTLDNLRDPRRRGGCLLALAHGGTVQALPRAPHGTTLRMVLPLPHAVPADAAQDDALEQPA